MKIIMIKIVWILLISLSLIGLYECESNKIDLLMPNVSPQTVLFKFM